MANEMRNGKNKLNNHATPRSGGAAGMSRTRLFGVVLLILALLACLFTACFTYIYNNNNGGQELGGISHVTANADVDYTHPGVVEDSSWVNAINNSSATTYRKFKLTSDWVAYPSGNYNEIFGSGTGYYGGSLSVPAGKSVILDLNGHTIRRNAASYNVGMNGDVFRVWGNLIITDSSASGAGKITGGKVSGATMGNIYGKIYYAGGLTIMSGANVTLERGAITGNLGNFTGTAGQGGVGGVYVASGGKFNMTGGSVNGNMISDDVFNNSGKEHSTAGIWVASGGVMNMSGGTVSGNSAKYSYTAIRRDYAVLGVRVEGTLNMTGGSIENHTIPNDSHYASPWGTAGVSVENGGKFTMEGGTIRNNKSLYTGGDSFGAGVFVNNNSTFTMKGGTISGNQLAKNANGTRAAGVFFGAGCTFIATGGTITGNTATGTNSVGGVVAAPTTKIENLTITNNTGDFVGGMYAGVTVSTSFAGANNITGNKKGSAASNVYLPAGAKLNVTGDLTGSNIGVTSAAIGFITNGFEEHNPDLDPADIFKPDVAKIEITLESGEVYYFLTSNENLWMRAVQRSLANDGRTETFTMIENWTAASGKFSTKTSETEGYYTAGQLCVPAGANIVLDLAGFTLNRALTAATGNGFVILVNGDLTIVDSSEAGTGKITGGWSNSVDQSGGILVHRTGSLKIEGGEIYGNKTAAASSAAGGIYVRNGGSFEMTGGEIYGNSATNASGVDVCGGVGVAEYGTATLTGGYIHDNTKGDVYLIGDWAQLNLGGSIRICDTGDTLDLFRDSGSQTQKINIVSSFTDEARIELDSRCGLGVFTSGYGVYNEGRDPATVFFPAGAEQYIAVSGSGSAIEAFLKSNNPGDYWVWAVTNSAPTLSQTVQLDRDWTASGSGTNNKSFGTGTGYLNGALHVPATANVILDLNGHTVSRALTAASATGYVIYVQGKLTIIDSSEERDPETDEIITAGTGKITGGFANGSTTASVIVNGAANSGAVLNLYAGSIADNKSTLNSLISCTSGVLATGAGATFNMYGGAVTNNTGTRSVGVGVTVGATFNMYGGEISYNTAEAGNFAGAVVSSTSSKMNITGGRIVGNTGPYTIYAADSVINISNVEIAENVCNLTSARYADYTNAGLNVPTVLTVGQRGYAASSVTLSNVWIHDNKDISGQKTFGAISVHDGNTLTLDNCVIENNESYYGAIYNAGRVNLIGTEITGNKTTNSANGWSGVYVAEGGELSIEGKVQIYDNAASNSADAQQNVYLAGQNAVILVTGELDSDTQIGVSRLTFGVLTSGFGEHNANVDPSEYFFANDGKLILTHTGTLGDSDVELYAYTHDNYTLWLTAVHMSLDNGGAPVRIVMYEDWTAENGSFGVDPFVNNQTANLVAYSYGMLYVPEGAHIILNMRGHTIDRALQSAVVRGAVIGVCGNLELISDTRENDPAPLYLYNGGYEPELEEREYTAGQLFSDFGTVTGGYNSYADYAGGIAIFGYENATLTIDNVKITGNTQTGASTITSCGTAGGIRTTNMASTSLILRNVEISDNVATGAGSYGGLAVLCPATYENVIISNNTGVLGGGIRIGNNSTTDFAVKAVLTDCFITDNEGGTTSTGGIASFRDLEMVRCTVSGNKGSLGGISASRSLTLTNCEVTGNEGTTGVGGVNTSTNNVETVFDHTKISGNKTASGTAAGVVVNNAVAAFTMTGGEICENEGGSYAAGIYVPGNASLDNVQVCLNKGGNYAGGIYAGANLDLNNVDVQENTATGSISAGGIYMANGVLNMHNGTINKNEGVAGGVYLAIGTFELAGGEINENVGTRAGGIYAIGTVNMTGGVISGNEATIGAGGVYVYSSNASALNMTGGEISSNKADGAGGVFVYSTGALTMGGSVKVLGNTKTDGTTKSNIYFDLDSNMIQITSQFKSGTEIWITRRPIGPFTSGYGVYNSGIVPTFIFNSDLELSEIVTEGTGTDMEGAIKSYDNEINWAWAVAQSLRSGGDQYEVTLYYDWSAQVNNLYTTSFGTGTGYLNGGLYVPSGANILLHLNGFVVDRDVPDTHSSAAVINGYVLYVEGFFRMEDGTRTATPTGNPSEGEYGAGTIRGGWNSSAGSAGGVHVAETGEFYMDGGVIAHNGASLGQSAGGVYVAGLFEMTGGKIVDNYAYGTGGILVSETGVANLTNVEITANTSTNGTGGVRVLGTGTLRVGESILISENTLDSGLQSNVYLSSEQNHIIVTSALSGGSKIGVTRRSISQITSGYGNYNTLAANGYFYSDDEKFFVTQMEVNGVNEAFMNCFDSAMNWTYAVESSLASGGDTQTVVLWADWTAEKHVNYDYSFGSTTGYIYGALYVPEGASIVLDLRGYTIDRYLESARDKGYVFIVEGELIIKDSGLPEGASTNGTGVGTIRGGWNNSNSSAGGILVTNGPTSHGKLVLEGGVIAENQATGSGSAGGVYVANGSDFSMVGGKISGNVGYSAGGVLVAGNANFSMTSGEVVANSSLSNTGGVRLETNGKLALGGDAVINTNTSTAQRTPSNLYMVSPNAVINIETELTTADIHLTRTSIGTFTNGLEEACGNPNVDPRNYFKSDHNDYYVSETDTDNGKEAFMMCLNNASNWAYAVQTSLANGGRTETVTLTADWLAAEDGNYTRSFGSADPGYSYGRLHVPKNASIILDLNGHTIDRQLDVILDNIGSVFYVEGTLIIIDSSEVKDDATGEVLTPGTGVITGGKSSATGGIYNSGHLTLAGGTITGNVSAAANNAGGVYNKGTFTMTGGAITGNIGAHAGVYVTSNATMELGGSAVISGNVTEKDGSEEANLYFESPTAVINIVSSFASTAQISLLREEIGPITSGYSLYNQGVNPATIFSSESDFYVISTTGVGVREEVALVSFDNDTNWSYAVRTSLATGNRQIVTLYEDWNAKDGSFGEGVGYLNGGLYVPRGASITLDLNGYSIDRLLEEAQANGFVFKIEGSLIITNYNAEKVGSIRGGNSTNSAGGIQIESSGTVEFENGIIEGNNTTAAAAGAGVTALGTFSMTGGSVNDNTGNICGGVYVAASGRLELGGSAKIKDNTNAAGDLANIYMASGNAIVYIVAEFTEQIEFTITRNGLGIFTDGFGRFNNQGLASFKSENSVYEVSFLGSGSSQEATMITKNNAMNWDFAVQASLENGGAPQTFTLWSQWDAAPNNDTTTAFGTDTRYYINGALYVPAGASIVLDLNGNTLNRALESARSGGYVIYVAGSLTIKDMSETQTGTITGGRSSTGNTAGGIVVVRNGSLNLLGGTIQGNYGTSGNNAGGVFNNGEFTMAGGAIIGNTGLAGGVYNAAYGTFVMEDGDITENQGTNVGGVYVYNSEFASFTMAGGTIADNTAISAGGVYASGKVNMTGGAISGNVATGTTTSNGGGAGIYIPSTGDVTIVGGVIRNNKGLNGVRVYSSGSLKLGGSAQIYNNLDNRGNYNNVYRTVRTQRIEIISEFEKEAFIGVMSDVAGVFTTGYGEHNLGMPGLYFFSDIDGYAISATEVTNENGDKVTEATVGTPVEQPVAATSPIYDGTAQVIITGFDPRYMTYGQLPAGVTYDPEEGFKAVNAGQYELTFTPLAGYCWTDGSSGALTVFAVVSQRVAELEWEHLDDLYFTGKEVLPTAYVSNLIEGDACDVIVTGKELGGQINVGEHTAVASFLSNSNYTLRGAEDVEKLFLILKTHIVVTITSTVAYYGTPLELKLDGNIGNGPVTFEIVSGEENADLFDKTLTPREVGEVVVKAYVAETPNTYAAESEETTIVIEKGYAALDFEGDSTVYGDNLTVNVTGNENEGDVTLDVTPGDDGGDAYFDGNVLVPVHVGTVTVTMFMDGTNHYHPTTVTKTITISPRPVIIKWDSDTLEFTYDGWVHIPEAEVDGLVNGDSCGVVIAGGQIDACEIDPETGDVIPYIATAVLLDNVNYTLIGATDATKEFVINRATLEDLAFVDKVVKYGEELVLSLENNYENGEVVYSIQLGGTGKATIGGENDDTLIPEEIGRVAVLATVGGSRNYAGGTCFDWITIERGTFKVELLTTEAVYGVNLVLDLDGNLSTGELTYTVIGGTGSALIEGNTFKPYHVGEVAIEIRIAQTNYYEEIVQREYINIVPLAAILDWVGPKQFTYNGSEQAPEAVVANLVFGDVCNVTVSGFINAGNGLIATAVELDNENYTLVYDADPDSPDYTPIYNLDPNEPDTRTCEFDILPIQVTLNWGGTKMLYTGEPQAPTATIFNLVPGDDVTVIVEGAQVDVGEDYIATAIAVSSPNYTLERTPNVSVKFSILKAPLDVKVLTKRVPYGKPVDIELDGYIGGGKITWTVHSGNEFAYIDPLTNKLVPTGFGTITVSAHINETKNTYAFDIPRTNIEIYKDMYPVEFEVKELVYGDSMELAIIEYASEHEDALIEVIDGLDNVTVDGTTLTATGIGSVTLRVTMPGNKWFLDTDIEIVIPIVPRPIKVTWLDELQYTGEEQLPSPDPDVAIENLVDGDTVEFELTGAKINLGSYVATVVEILNPNYTFETEEEFKVSFTIVEADLDIQLDPTSVSIDDTAQLSVIGNLGEGAVTYTVIDSTGSAVLGAGDVLTPLTAGKIVIRVQIAAVPNYNAFDDYFDFEILPLEVDMTLEDTSTIYGEELQLVLASSDPDALVGRVVTYEIYSGTDTDGEFVADGTTIATIDGDVLTPVTAGKVIVHVMIEATTQYDACEFDIEVTINPRPVTLEWTYPTFVYTGEEQVPVATVVNLVNGDEAFEVTVSGSIDAGIDLEATAIELANPNYTVEGGINVVTLYTIDPLPVVLEWEEPRVYPFTSNPIVPKAWVTNLVPRDAALVVESPDEICAVTVGGMQIDVCPIDPETGEAVLYIATASALSNSNYTLIGIDDDMLEKEFEIVKSNPPVELVTLKAYYGTDLKLEIEGNIGEGNVTYTVLSGTDIDGNYVDDGNLIATLTGGDMLHPVEIGTVTIRVNVDETFNTYAFEQDFVVEVAKGYLPLDLEAKEVTYGSELLLVMTGNVEGEEETFTLGENGTGSATLEERDGMYYLTDVQAGTVEVILNVKESAHYEETTVSVFVTVNPFVLEIEWDTENTVFTYNGTEQAPNAWATNLLGDDECDIVVEGAIDAGNGLIATAVGTTNPNYTVEGGSNLTQTFDILPLPATIVWSNTSFDYDGEAHAPTATVSNAVSGDTVTGIVSGEQTNAGTYTATLTGLSSANYSLEGVTNLSCEFRINKITPNTANLHLEVSPDQIRYGQTGTLYVRGELVGNGARTYTLHNSAQGSIVGNQFTARALGNVYIRTYIAETANTYATYFDDYIYVRKAQQPITGVTPGRVMYGTTTTLTPVGLQENPNYYFKGYWGSEGVGGNSVTARRTGWIQAYLYASETEHYEGLDKYLINIYVAPRDYTITWSNLEFTYNGQPQAPTATVHSFVMGEWYNVRLDGVGTDAGTYTVTALGLDPIRGDENYNLTGNNLSITYTIGKATIKPKITSVKTTIDQDLPLTISGNTGNAPVRYELLSGGTGSAILTTGPNGEPILHPTSLGTVIVKAIVEEGTNYHGAETEPTTITIGKRFVPLEIESLTVMYGEVLDLRISGNVENGLISLSLQDETGSATLIGTTIYPVTAGTVILTTRVSETENYQETVKQWTVKILPRPVTIEWDKTVDFAYDGKLHAPTATATGMLPGDTANVIVSGAQINAGRYTATATGLSNPNYTVVGIPNPNCPFEIHGVTPKIEIVPSTAYLGTDLKLTVSGNVGGGTVTYSIMNGTGSARLVGDILVPESCGYVVVTANVAETPNTTAASTVKQILIDLNSVSVSLVTSSTVYGTKLKLEVSGNAGGGEVSFMIVPGYEEYATLNGDILTPIKVGTIEVQVLVGGTKYYKPVSATVPVEIAPRPVQLVWGNLEFDYNGEEQKPTALVINRASVNDEVEVDVKGYIDAGENLVAEAIGVSNPNYTVEGGTPVTCVYTIHPIVVELDWQTPETPFIYNGEEQAPTAKIANPQSPDDADIRILVTGSKDAGENCIATATSIASPNYTLDGCENNLFEYEIEQLVADLYWGQLNLIYDGAIPRPEVEVDNLKADDTCEVEVDVSPYSLYSMMRRAASTGDVKTYLAEAVGLSNENYALPDDESQLIRIYTVEPGMIGIFWGNLTLTYTGEYQLPEMTLYGVDEGDDVSLEVSFIEGNGIDAGKQVIRVTLVGDDASNYSLSDYDSEHVFTILPKDITVYIKSIDKTLLYTGVKVDPLDPEAYKDWYVLETNDLVGRDYGFDVKDLLSFSVIWITPEFWQNGRQVDAIAGGDYEVHPYIQGGSVQGSQTNLVYENKNYAATFVVSTEYGTLTISDKEVLRLSDGSTYQFITLRDISYGPITFTLRMGYKDLGWTHGEDDAYLDRVVLGQIMPETSINSFLSNFDSTQLNSIRIYNSYDNLVFDCGTVQSPYDMFADNGDFLGVGTGWRVELIAGGNIIDTVYISVLGDLDGDGHIGGDDVNALYEYIACLTTFEGDEYRLAGMITNGGVIGDAGDINALYNVIQALANIQDYFL